MNKSIAAAALSLGIALAGATSAGAAGVPQNLRCFTDPGATCTLTKDGAHLVAVDGAAAGVYVNAKKTNGKPISAVDYSFSWTGTPNGGAPRFSIPIDQDRNGSTDGYAFIDWNSCGNAVTGGTVSTTSSACGVYYGPTFYANWDAFALANPTYRISNDIPFIIVDVPADVVVTNVTFG